MTDEPTNEPRNDEPPSSGYAPPPPRVRPPLVRRTDDRILGGVASGIADWLDVDTTIVRIGFVVLGVMNGIGVIAYLAAWLLIPEDTDPAATAARHGRTSGGPQSRRTDLRDRGPAFWIGIALLAIASLMIVSTMPVLRGVEVGPAIVLIAIGVALWQMSQRSSDRPPGSGDPAAWMPPPHEGPSWPAGEAHDPTVPFDPTTTARSETVSAAPTDATERWTPPPVPSRRERRASEDRGHDWTPPPVPPKERSFLGRVVLAVALIAAGVLTSLSIGGQIAVTAVGVLATVIFILGLGLMIGSVFGRARWLGLVALILLPFLVAASVASSLGIDLGDGVGERSFSVTGPTLAPSYELGAGQMILDLRQVDPEGRILGTSARLGAGEMIVIVPMDVEVVIDAEANLGELVIVGSATSGQQLERRVTIPARDERTGDVIEPRGTLQLDLSVGAGQILVRQEPTVRETSEEFTR